MKDFNVAFELIKSFKTCASRNVSSLSCILPTSGYDSFFSLLIFNHHDDDDDDDADEQNLLVGLLLRDGFSRVKASMFS